MFFRIKYLAVAAGAFLSASAAFGALSRTEVLLPVSDGQLSVGEWSSNFGGALSVADAYGIPLVVFYGGLSCGKCEELQMACLTDEFLAWQASHKMLMVFTTNNSTGNASAFARPDESTGYPYIAVYWNNGGGQPAKNSEHYIAFNGRDGEMPAKGGSLASQFIGSIESVVAGYDFSSTPDISVSAEMLYTDPVTSRLSYDIGLFTGLDASAAFVPQTVYNVSEASKPKLKKVAGKLPSGVKLLYSNGSLSLSGSAKKAGSYQYVFSIQQKRNGIVHAGPNITLSFIVAAADDASMGGCAMLGRALKATVPVFAAGGAGTAAVGSLDFAATARGKITAKYTDLSRSKASFTGSWTSIEGGCALALLTSRDKKRTLAVELAGDGRFKAVVSDAAQSSALESPDGIMLCTGLDAAAFAGQHAAGSVVVKKITSAGRVAWTATLESGRKASGKAFAMIDGEGCCIVQLFKVASRYAVNEVLRIRSGVQEPELISGSVQ